MNEVKTVWIPAETPRKRIKVYELFGSRMSPKTVDYHGQFLYVAATSLRQAMAVGHKGKWINPDADRPIGIIAEYSEYGTTLWCGCRGHGVHIEVSHMGGLKQIRKAIAEHECAVRA